MNKNYETIVSVLSEGKIALLETMIEGTTGDNTQLKQNLITLSSPGELDRL